MTIRQRGESWQIDIRTLDGKRLRRDFRSKAEALEAEAKLKLNPEQRTAMKKLRRKSSARSEFSKSVSAKPYSAIVDISAHDKLERATSRLSAVSSKVSKLLTVNPCTANSEGYSGRSGPGLPASQASRPSPLSDRAKLLSTISNSK
jgi:hypothetical protein